MDYLYLLMQTCGINFHRKWGNTMHKLRPPVNAMNFDLWYTVRSVWVEVIVGGASYSLCMSLHAPLLSTPLTLRPLS